MFPKAGSGSFASETWPISFESCCLCGLGDALAPAKRTNEECVGKLSLGEEPDAPRQPVLVWGERAGRHPADPVQGPGGSALGPWTFHLASEVAVRVCWPTPFFPARGHLGIYNIIHGSYKITKLKISLRCT